MSDPHYAQLAALAGSSVQILVDIRPDWTTLRVTS
jgi:hypothetical protein